MKLKVSKEVGEVLEKCKANNPVMFFALIYTEMGCKYDLDFMERNNLTDEDLINAYKYGWEVEYEFQAEDVVKWLDDNDKENLRIVSQTNGDKVYFTSGLCDWMPKKMCCLVSKKENREDLKQ